MARISIKTGLCGKRCVADNKKTLKCICGGKGHVEKKAPARNTARTSTEFGSIFCFVNKPKSNF